MALYPPCGMLKPLEPNICWESDLRILVDCRVLPIHRSVLNPTKSRFLMDLFEDEAGGADRFGGSSQCGDCATKCGTHAGDLDEQLAEDGHFSGAAVCDTGKTADGTSGTTGTNSCTHDFTGDEVNSRALDTSGRHIGGGYRANESLQSPVPISPPCSNLLHRALHAITVGTRPELTEDEYVGFVRLSAFLQSEELDLRLCEVALASWRSLTKLDGFRNPIVPAAFVKRFMTMARALEVISLSEAFEVIAIWSLDEIAGGDNVLWAIATPEQIEASVLTKLQIINPRFVELMTPTAVFNIMRRSTDAFI